MNTFIVFSLLFVAAVQGSRFHHFEDDDMDGMLGDAVAGAEVLLNWDDTCNKMVNDLIKLEIESTFQSIAIAVFFRRHDADVIGLSLMYNAWARTKINSAKDLMMYLVKRGANVKFTDISKPAETQWDDPSKALSTSLAIERNIAVKINELVKHAQEHNDAHLMSFVARQLVNQQADNIFEVASLINKLAKGGNKFGLMAINAQTVKKYKGFKDDSSDTEKYKWNY